MLELEQWSQSSLLVLRLIVVLVRILLPLCEQATYLTFTLLLIASLLPCWLACWRHDYSRGCGFSFVFFFFSSSFFFAAISLFCLQVGAGSLCWLAC